MPETAIYSSLSLPRSALSPLFTSRIYALPEAESPRVLVIVFPILVKTGAELVLSCLLMR
ncbi:MAG: hypothetical protein IJS39_00740 [Synergistaceae bacterium]|nr:hypothetical protein [Synergistaceae bacterium]